MSNEHNTFCFTQNCRLSWLELGGMGWSGFGAVTFLVTKRLFWTLKQEPSSRNSLIPLFPGRDSNPHEGNPHRILSPVRLPRTSKSTWPYNALTGK